MYINFICENVLLNTKTLKNIIQNLGHHVFPWYYCNNHDYFTNHILMSLKNIGKLRNLYFASHGNKINKLWVQICKKKEKKRNVSGCRKTWRKCDITCPKLSMIFKCVPLSLLNWETNRFPQYIESFLKQMSILLSVYPPHTHTHTKK